MEMPSLLARKWYRNFSPRPLGQGLGLSAAVPPAIHSLAVCLETCSSKACSEQIWVQWTSVAETTQLLEGGSSPPIPCHPSSNVQRILYCQTAHSSHQCSSSGSVCLALLSSKREPIIISVAGGWVCVTKQHRPLSLDPRSSVSLQGLLLNTFSLDMS